MILLEAVERMPDSAALHYKLAAYEAQLGEVETAKARLKEAFVLEASIATQGSRRQRSGAALGFAREMSTLCERWFYRWLRLGGRLLMPILPVVMTVAFRALSSRVEEENARFLFLIMMGTMQWSLAAFYCAGYVAHKFVATDQRLVGVASFLFTITVAMAIFLGYVFLSALIFWFFPVELPPDVWKGISAFGRVIKEGFGWR